MDEGSKVVNTWFVDSPVQSLSALPPPSPHPQSSDMSPDSVLNIKTDPFPSLFPGLEQSLTLTETQSDIGVPIEKENLHLNENEALSSTLLPTQTLNPDLDRAAEFVRDATAVLIVAGAGISSLSRLVILPSLTVTYLK